MKYMNQRYYEANPDNIGGETGSAAEAPVEESSEAPAESNWRSEWSGGDEAVAKQLERYSTPNDAAKALVDAKARIREGNLAQPLPEDATEDDLARYREEHGIPAEASGYLENLPEGLVIGEETMPIFESLAEHLHGKNASPEMVHGIAEWYNGVEEEIHAQRRQDDMDSSSAAEDMFREEWGADYRANVNIVKNFITSELGEQADELLAGRDANGEPLMNNPAVVNWVLKTAREMAPMSTIVGGQGNQINAGRKDEIEALMGDKNSAYWKGDKADAMQEELRKIYEAEAKAAERQR